MILSDVLILGTKQSANLVKLVKATGHRPVVRHDLTSALNSIRSTKHSIIVVDYAQAPTDVLEFVLNARDIVQDAHILVVGKDTRNIKKEMVTIPPGTSCVNHKQLKHKLTPTHMNIDFAKGKRRDGYKT